MGDKKSKLLFKTQNCAWVSFKVSKNKITQFGELSVLVLVPFSVDVSVLS